MSAGAGGSPAQQGGSQVCRLLYGFKIGHVHIRDVCIIFLTPLLLEWFRPVARGCGGEQRVGEGMDGWREDLHWKHYHRQRG
ncbi:hypothetical protein PBY51_002173 [Eleginops maclovinus]|uniref:Uncharacterized protein n=1 Tax=Eleginops maclovinus TaxID=56733 RepID=A0AAN7WXT1_ELEMC|nr:hypothetical protein PBY51_002173 [Eleginops maclovinus]